MSVWPSAAAIKCVTHCVAIQSAIGSRHWRIGLGGKSTEKSRPGDSLRPGGEFRQEGTDVGHVPSKGICHAAFAGLALVLP